MSDSWIFMPELKRTLVFYEGDDDKAFLEKLKEVNLLPGGWQIANRSKEQHPGKDGLVRQLLPVVSPVNGIDGRAVVLVDLDEMTPAKRADWFSLALADALRQDKKYTGVSLESAVTRGLVRGYRLISGVR